MQPILDHWYSLHRSRAQRDLVLGSDRSFTVEDVQRLAQDLERRLSSVDTERPVLLLANHGPGFLAALLGLWMRGAVPVLGDTNLPAAARRQLISDMGCSAVVQVQSRWPRDEKWCTVERCTEVDCSVPDLPIRDGVLKLTSGTSGRSRAVAATAEQLAADEAALTEVMELGPRDRILASIPLNHSYGFASVALPALIRGTRLAVPEGEGPFAPFTAARRHEVTFIPTVPAYLRGLVAARRPPPAPDSLRTVVSAGAPLPPATAQQFAEKYSIPVHSFYGSSETGGITYDRVGGAALRGTVGHAIPGVVLSLASESGEHEAAEDDRQESRTTNALVVVRSPAVATAYYPHPDARLEGGVYQTNDRGRFACDGELILLGRGDRQFSVRGKQVDPAEIEDLALRIDGVEEAACVQVDAPDSTAAQRPIRLVIAGDATRVPTIEYLRSRCQQVLPPHKRPRSFIVVDRLPRTSRGKVDFASLRRPGFDG